MANESVGEPYLRAFIDEAPAAIAMFDRDMRYLAASQRWMESIFGGGRNIIGRLHYQLLPSIPQAWKDLHLRALAGETLRLDEDRFQRSDGRTIWLRREIRPWHDAGGAVGGIIIFAEDVTAKIEAEQALRESEQRLRLAVASGHMGMWDWDVKADTHVWNDECYRLLGYEPGEIEPSFSAVIARVHPDDRAAVGVAIESARREHKDYFTEFRVARPDGTVRWVRANGQFLYNGDREPVRLIGLKEDITEERQQIETQRVLIAELQHRTRNLMAVVESIAHETLKTAESLKDFEVRFDQRLKALSRVQSLLSRSDDGLITIGTLVGMEFEAIGADTFGDRIEFGGPEVLLRKSAVEMLSLAIHELATNAFKYGALAIESGRISLIWRVEGLGPNGRLVVEWIERGILLSALPADQRRKGYGRTLIEEALPYSLSAETKFELGEDALLCRIALPLATSGIA